MKIYVDFNQIPLGYLAQINNAYAFVAFEEGFNKAKLENVFVLKMFPLNTKGEKIFLSLPTFFEQFLPSKERTDLIKKAQIKDCDSKFEKLYKIAGLKNMAINFQLRQG